MQKEKLDIMDVFDEHNCIRPVFIPRDNSEWVPHGQYEILDESGNLKMTVTYSHGVVHGAYVDYWPNGQIASTGHFDQGHRDGLWHYNNADGTLRETIHFEKGKEINEWTSQYKSWKETLLLLNQRIEQDPKDASSWCNRGIALAHLGDFEGAARDFKESLRLHPNSVYALWGRGDLYTRMNQHAEAFVMYNKAIALAPEDPRSYSHRGKGYLEQERYDEAIADFSRAIDLAPDRSMPYYWRAGARENIKDYHGALSDYKEFIQLESECQELIAEVHALRAFVYMELELYQEAIADFSAKLEYTPLDAEILLMRGRAYLKTGNRKQALEDRNKALEIDPNVMDE